jgi:hypothetical protein
MGDRESKAAAYRRQAAAGLEIAERMSIRHDRALMLALLIRDGEVCSPQD